MPVVSSSEFSLRLVKVADKYPCELEVLASLLGYSVSVLCYGS